MPGAQRLLSIVSLLITILLSVLSIHGFGWWLGLTVTVVVIAFHHQLAHTKAIHAVAQRLLQTIEPNLLRFVERFGGYFGLQRGGVSLTPSSNRVHSSAELAHTIDQAGTVLKADQKQLLQHALQFDSYTISDVMTARDEIVAIDHKELLGPLVLDDLHKTGHSFFPVTRGDIDHIIGILPLGELVTLGSKRSLTAETAMLPQIQYVAADQSLRQALQLLLSTHQQLLVVANKQHETMGMVTLGDVMHALFGPRAA